MTASEIRAAVDAGLTVHWSSAAYRVIKDSANRYMVLCDVNGSCVGLTNVRECFTCRPINGN